MSEETLSRADEYRAKAQEHEFIASLCAPSALRTELMRVAQSYRSLAEQEDWLAAQIVLPADATESTIA
jgi:hypothetical protein